MKLTILIIFIAFPILLLSQNIVLRGLVIDKSNGSRVSDALVYDSVSQQNTLTDSLGRFTLTQMQSQVNLVIYYIGKPVYQLDTTITSNSFLKVKFNANKQLNEVIIEDERIKRVLLNPSNEEISLNLEALKTRPVVIGQADVLKGLQFIPGVSGGKEGSSDLLVRGGNNDQNLMLIDGAPVFGNYHLGGYISAFDPNFFDSVKFYKSGFRPEHGGRLSSIVDMSLKEGNYKKYETKADIGILAEGFSFSGPLISNKLSVAFGARRFNYDFFLRPATAILLDGNGSIWYNFSDYNIKFAYKKSIRCKLSLTLFYNRDKISFVDYYFDFSYDLNIDKFTTPWHNKVASFNWNYSFTEKTNSRLTVYYSRFDILYNLKTKNFTSNNIFKSIARKKLSESGFNYQIDSRLGKLQITTGTKASYVSYTPLYFTEKYFANKKLILQEEFNVKHWGSAFNLVPFAGLGLKISKNAHFKVAMRHNVYFYENTSYKLLQPRASFDYTIKNTQLFIRYDKMVQPYQSILSYSNGLGLDNWTIATDKIIPAQSEQLSLGLNSMFKDWTFSVEAYIKRMKNLAAYKNGYALADLNDYWESAIWNNGKAFGKGIEILASKNFDKLDIQWAYTLAWHQRQFWRINNNKPFWYLYDERNRFDLQGSYQLFKDAIFSFNWSFGSGLPITLAKSIYLGAADGSLEYGYVKNVLYEYDGLNNERMQITHRLDLGLSLVKQKNYGTKTINFGLYNAYNRMNPSVYLYKNEKTGVGLTGYERRLKKVTFFPIMPYFSINYTLDQAHIQKKLRIHKN